MIKLTEIAWLAGLLEGEGCFALCKRNHPSIRLGMNDEDVVTHAAILLGSRAYRYKTTWLTRVNGVVAIQWMMTLYPYFGKRRRSVVADVIKVWKETYYRAPNGSRTMAKCHPDRVMVARDMCQQCYDKRRVTRIRKKKLTIEQWRAKAI